ncbi:MAG TPA: hypothetical protein DDW27_02345 [Bacteroidales bacterium]|nr:hypothetical protein [Bacteroidales bacterium]
MKKICTIIICGMLAIPLMAVTYRVNNQLTANTSAKIYTDLQAAHNAAANGDTIMVEGSPLIYGDAFTCTKRLFIKGPGYFLDENPGISANKLAAQFTDQFNLDVGSSGTVIMGIVHQISYMNVNTDNITIRRCQIGLLPIKNGVSNLTISGCYFETTGIYPNIGSNLVTNLIVTNCIIINAVNLLSGCTGTFINNIFTSNSIFIPTGFVMKNNIMFTTEKTGISLPALDAAVSYNMSISDHFGTANNNKANVSATALFVGDATESTDGEWRLKAGSPALAAGEGGADCGAFGGPNPYILSGLPVGPVIYELNVSSYVKPDGKLPMTIKVKAW